MTRTVRRSGIATFVVLLALAALGWRYGWRTRPEQVAARFVDALVARHPGTTIGAWLFGRLPMTLSSGMEVDARLPSVFDECGSHPLRCSAAIERALDDVDRIVAASRAPDRALLEPVVVDAPGGHRDEVAEPLFGALEVRYALVSGVASTFVTTQIASQLGMTPPALREAALERLRADTSARLVRIDETDAVVYDVGTGGDAPASLLDRDRMRRLAGQMAAHRLYIAIPARGVLYLAQADDAGASALTMLSLTTAASRPRLLAYDTEATDGPALSFARRRR